MKRPPDGRPRRISDNNIKCHPGDTSCEAMEVQLAGSRFCIRDAESGFDYKTDCCSVNCDQSKLSSYATDCSLLKGPSPTAKNINSG
jgi:hypothetical protein